MLVSRPGIDSADKLGVQAQPCAARAAAGPGEPLARPRGDSQSQVRGKAFHSWPHSGPVPHQSGWITSIVVVYSLLHLASNTRYKGKSYRATVEVVRTADRVAEFCRKTCIKLECCPNLFGPRMVLDRCSENCSVLTKTKYSKWFDNDGGDDRQTTY